MSQRQMVFWSFGLLVVCSLVSFAFNDCIGNDAASYYVPMAELFAEGKYDLAFNPGIPPLMPFLAGIVTAVLPVSGFLGLKTVAALFMCLGMLPMYYLARRLVPRDQAVWACVLYAVCAQVIRFGITAQLTSAKFFLVLWLIERCVSVSERLSLKGVITLGVAMALLALCRTEGIFYIAPVGVAMVVATFKLQGAAGRRVIKTLVSWCLLIGTCLLIWSPWLVYEYKATGYAVLDSRQKVILEKFCAVAGFGTNVKPEDAPQESPQEPVEDVYAQTLGTKLGETLDGLYIPYLPLVVIALIVLKKQGRWGSLELWLVSAALFNIVLIWAAATQGPPVLKRYIFPSALFLMPYAVLGWIQMKAWIVGKQSSAVQLWVTVILCSVVVVSVADGLKQVTDSLRGKYATDKEMGLWLRDHAHELDSNPMPEQFPIGKSGSHWTGRSFVIAGAFPQTACWAKAQHVRIDRRKMKTMQELMVFCRLYGVDVLNVDKAVRKSTLDFDPNHPGLRLVNTSRSDQGVDLYRLLPDS